MLYTSIIFPPRSSEQAFIHPRCHSGRRRRKQPQRKLLEAAIPAETRKGGPKRRWTRDVCMVRGHAYENAYSGTMPCYYVPW